jgi:hypothetical protein
VNNRVTSDADLVYSYRAFPREGKNISARNNYAWHCILRGNMTETTKSSRFGGGGRSCAEIRGFANLETASFFDSSSIGDRRLPLSRWRNIREHRSSVIPPSRGILALL